MKTKNCYDIPCIFLLDDISVNARFSHISGLYVKLKLLHCVIKGKIDLRAYVELKKTNEFSLIHSFFPMTKFEFLLTLLNEYRGKFFNFLPYKIRNSLRDLIYGDLLKKRDWI